MSEEQSWYYAKGDEKIGPISSAELKQVAASGRLLPSDYVWRTDWQEWKRADTLKNLFPPSIKSPPPPRSEKSVQTIQAATEAVEQVSQRLWFLDLRFESFATPRLIGFVFAASLVCLLLAFFVVIVYAVLNLPLIKAAFVIIVDLLLLALLAIWIRVCLEICLLGFRVAEHLKHLHYLEHLDKSSNGI